MQGSRRDALRERSAAAQDRQTRAPYLSMRPLTGAAAGG